MRAYAKAAAEIISIGKRTAIVLCLAAACVTSTVRADEPARPSNYTETIPGSAVRFEMVGIPGGTFSLGSPAGETGRGEDEVHGPPGSQAPQYALAACFGLIHGLGFSNYLRSLLGGEESIVRPLLAFNVGLEIGQLLIVAAVLLIGAVVTRLLRLTRREWVLLVSGGTIAVALTMIAERLRAPAA